MPVNATIVPIADFARQGSGTSILSTPVRTGERGLGGERTAAGKRAVLTIARANDGLGVNPTIDGTITVYGADIGNAASPAGVVGNAYATQASSATFQIVGDGSTTQFQSDIPYVAFSNNNFLVELQGFKLSGTFAVALSGVVTGTSGVAGQSKLGDTVIIGGFQSVISAFTDENTFTLTPAPAVAITAGATGVNVSRDRRFKTWIASGSLGSTNPELFTVTSVTVNGVALARIDFAIAPPKIIGPSTASTFSTGTPVAPSAVYFVTPAQLKAATANRFDRSGVRSYSVVWALGTHASNLLSAATVVLEHAAD